MSELTVGNYAIEADACKAFDQFVEQVPHLFGAYAEVEGYYLNRRVGVALSEPRIDRILIPKGPVVEAGWTHGPIGVEIKKSGIKAGRAVSQSLDYLNAAFRIEAGFRPRLILESCFIFPLDSTSGMAGSIMAQHRVGCAHFNHRGSLVFTVGGMRAIEVYSSGNVFARELPMGRKAGSR